MKTLFLFHHLQIRAKQIFKKSWYTLELIIVLLFIEMGHKDSVPNSLATEV